MFEISNFISRKLGDCVFVSECVHGLKHELGIKKKREEKGRERRVFVLGGKWETRLISAN